jgi:hypothetical protein
MPASPAPPGEGDRTDVPTFTAGKRGQEPRPGLARIRRRLILARRAEVLLHGLAAGAVLASVPVLASCWLVIPGVEALAAVTVGVALVVSVLIARGRTLTLADVGLLLDRTVDGRALLHLAAVAAEEGHLLVPVEAREETRVRMEQVGRVTRVRRPQGIAGAVGGLVLLSVVGSLPVATESPAGRAARARNRRGEMIRGLRETARLLTGEELAGKGGEEALASDLRELERLLVGGDEEAGRRLLESLEQNLLEETRTLASLEEARERLRAKLPDELSRKLDRLVGPGREAGSGAGAGSGSPPSSSDPPPGDPSPGEPRGDSGDAKAWALLLEGAASGDEEARAHLEDRLRERLAGTSLEVARARMQAVRRGLGLAPRQDEHLRVVATTGAVPVAPPGLRTLPGEVPRGHHDPRFDGLVRRYFDPRR